MMITIENQFLFCILVYEPNLVEKFYKEGNCFFGQESLTTFNVFELWFQASSPPKRKAQEEISTSSLGNAQQVLLFLRKVEMAV